MIMNSYSILNYLHFSHPTLEQEMVLNCIQAFIKEKNQLDFIATRPARACSACATAQKIKS